MLTTLEAARMCCADIEPDPIVIIANQLQIIADAKQGIKDDIADLLLYCQQELEKKNHNV